MPDVWLVICGPPTTCAEVAQSTPAPRGGQKTQQQDERAQQVPHADKPDRNGSYFEWPGSSHAASHSSSPVAGERRGPVLLLDANEKNVCEESARCRHRRRSIRDDGSICAHSLTTFMSSVLASL